MPHAKYRVAIVIPVYNVERYLQECLVSVEKLINFSTFQIIIINDGSTDRSGAIATVWAMNKKNVLVINQKNSGLGAARNRGLREVDAEFVTFLDSDDKLTNYSIDALYRNAQHRGSEIAVGKLETFPKKQNFIYDANHVGSPLRANRLEEAPLLIHNPSACNKIFSMDLVRRQHLKFGVGVHFEDVYFTIPALLAAKRISIIPRVTYLYRKVENGSSIMNGLFSRPKNYWDHLAANEYIFRRCYLKTTIVRKKLLERYFFRSIEGFTLRAPEALGSEAAIFFKRASRLYGKLDPRVAISVCRDIRHKLPFFAIFNKDFQLFQDGVKAIQDVVIRRGKIRFVLGSDFSGLNRATGLLEERRFEAFIDGFQADRSDASLRLAGRFKIPGYTFTKAPSFEVSIKVGNRRYLAETQLRLPSQNGEPFGWVDFSAKSHLRNLPNVTDYIWISLGASSSERISRRCLYARGFVRRFRSIRTSSRLVRLELEGQRPKLEVLPLKGMKAKLAVLKLRERQAKSDTLFLRERLLRKICSFFAPKEGYWLFSERSDTARESSKDLFNYLISIGRKNVRYVADDLGKDLGNLSNKRFLVKRNSLRHLALALNARLFVGTHDIYAYQMPTRLSSNAALVSLLQEGRSKFVFLQHGVIYNDVSPALNYEITGFEGFLTTCSKETDFVSGRFGLRHTVMPVGLPRLAAPPHPNLEQKPNLVLFAPTWRQWLGTPSYKSGFQADSKAISEFASMFSEILTSTELQKALTKTNSELIFMGHYELEYLGIDKLVSGQDRVRVVSSTEVDLAQLIRECSLFITDWSSTFFDAAYFGKPVIHYPFDEDKFRSAQYKEGYFNFDRHGFGPVARSKAKLLHEVVCALERGFTIETKYKRRAEKFFDIKVSLENCVSKLDQIASS